jgi:hypothetical protein
MKLSNNTKSTRPAGETLRNTGELKPTISKTAMQDKARQIANMQSKAPTASKTPVAFSKASRPVQVTDASRKTASAKAAKGSEKLARLTNKQVGDLAEKKARAFLRGKGFEVSKGQHNSTHGIDIVAFDKSKKGMPVFTEVKGSRSKLRPLSAMRKQLSPSWARDRFGKIDKHREVANRVRQAFGLKEGEELPAANKKHWRTQGVSVDLGANRIRLYRNGRTVSETSIKP